MAVTQAAFLQDRPYRAVSLTHFFVDVLNSSRNLLVALLAAALGFTNTQVAITLLLYNVGSSLSQPLFGWLADRIGARWLVVGGIGWMILFMAISALATEWIAMVALTLAGVGSGMFHPSGTMVASQTSRTDSGKATAVFFFSGQFGLFIGPLMAGILLDAFGRPGYVVLPFLALSAFTAGWRWLRDNPETINLKKEERAQARATHKYRHPAFIRQALLLVIIILAGSTVAITIITFTPVLFNNFGYTQTHVGFLAGIFMLGSALGTILGGELADRFPGKWIIILGMAGLMIPAYLYIPAEGIRQPVLLMSAGIFAGIPHPVLILSVQSLFPGRQAMASGVALGLMFAGGAMGSFLVGYAADEVFGLARAMQLTAFLPILGLVTALFLPNTKLNQP